MSRLATIEESGRVLPRLGPVILFLELGARSNLQTVWLVHRIGLGGGLRLHAWVSDDFRYHVLRLVVICRWSLTRHKFSTGTTTGVHSLPEQTVLSVIRPR